MPGKRQGKPKRGADQQLSQLVRAINQLSMNKNSRKRDAGKKGRGPAQPHFPLAPADDIRLQMKTGEIKLCLQNLAMLFKQGAGSCSLGDSGAVQFSVTFMLPTHATVRLINANTAQ